MKYDHYDGIPPHQNTDTSLEAAARILEVAGTLQARIYRYLLGEPCGRTDEQIQEHFGMNPSTERPRRIELQQKGLVADLGDRDTTRSGRKAIVWRVVPLTRHKPAQLPF